MENTKKSAINPNFQNELNLILNSPFFDEQWYLDKYADVPKNVKYGAAIHYLLKGWKEGKDPSAKFSTSFYLNIYPDIKMCPLLHFERFGKDEYRLINDPEKIVFESGLFDSEWYADIYPDIKNYRGSPLKHFLLHGWREKRNPSKKFDTIFYLESNKECLEKNICPIVHYEIFAKYKNISIMPTGYLPECLDLKRPSFDYKNLYMGNIDFSSYKFDIKTFVFYLPQFHRIKENDEWWGKGFTEWTHTSITEPFFPGHYQPREPHNDLGYYDLMDITTIKKQVILAKQHGITGFAIYYYWFSGKRLLEKPLEILFEHKEIDIEYCLIWANENFTRIWDGQEEGILLKQEYKEEDNLRFIKDIAKYFNDKRYLRIEGKPLIIVYAPRELPEPKKTFQCWREEARKMGVGEIEIWTCQTKFMTAHSLDIENEVDGEIQFPPHLAYAMQLKRENIEDKFMLFDYNDVVRKQFFKSLQLNPDKLKLHRTSMLAWDNAPRIDTFRSYVNFSGERFYHWVQNIAEYTRKNLNGDDRIIFVNAWNEWGEGTYLEPDRRYGYANLDYLSQGILNLIYNGQKLDNLNIKKYVKADSKIDKDAKIAVQIHIFYLDLIEEIINNLKNIPFKYDIYISTDSEYKKRIIEFIFQNYYPYQKFRIDVLENSGRDIGPFLIQMRKYINKYKYICHIHTKRSFHQDTAQKKGGNAWREYLYDNLIGNEDIVSNIINIFENYSYLGMVTPVIFPPIASWQQWGSNKKMVKKIFRLLKYDLQYFDEIPEFPGGNMFWARAEAIKDIFSLDFVSSNFGLEEGKLDGTLAHAVERAWYYLINYNGYIWVNYTPKKYYC